MESSVFAAFRKNDNELVRIEKLIGVGDLATAANALNALRARAIEDPRIYSVGAELGFAAKNATAALQSVETALRLAPGWPRALFQRAKALEALNRTKEALEACNQAVSTDPKLLGAVELSVSLGRRLGETEIPESLLRKAHTAAPNNSSIWLGLGRFLSRHKKEESVLWLEKVLAVDANNLDALVTLTAVSFELNRMDQAHIWLAPSRSMRATGAYSFKRVEFAAIKWRRYPRQWCKTCSTTTRIDSINTLWAHCSIACRLSSPTKLNFAIRTRISICLIWAAGADC
jgi:tetratricopeptide (TPR) repeat protein